jgi:hypothetical protein
MRRDKTLSTCGPLYMPHVNTQEQKVQIRRLKRFSLQIGNQYLQIL